MAKILNIVNGLCTEWCMRQARPLEDVKAPCVDIQFGILPFDFSEQNLQESLTSNYRSRSIGGMSKEDSVTDLLAYWRNFLDVDFHSYDEVVVWHGDVPTEQILLNLMSKISPGNLFEVDLRRSAAVYDRRRVKDKNYTISFDMLSLNDYYEIDADNIKSKVSDERICCLRGQWDAWAKSRCRYRLNDECSEVRGYPDDAIDEEIFRELSSTKDILSTAEAVMESSRFWLSDKMVLYRIFSLLRKKKLKVVM